MKHHILLLENDPQLVTDLKSVFASYHLQVTAVSTIKEAQKIVIEQEYKLVIVDRIVDDGDGLDFVSYLRDWYPGIHILCLSSKGQVNERIRGFSKGADDYLPKPFATQELLLRVQSLLKKQKVSDAPCWELHNLRFYPENGMVIKGEYRTVLRRKENQLLLFLLRHKGQVVTRKMIIDSLWPGDQELPLESTLDVYIRRLRLKLKTPDMITTFRGYGYMIATY